MKKYFLLLSDQTVIIGGEFEIMKHWRRFYLDKKIVEMLPTRKPVGGTIRVMSLSKFIDTV